MIAAVTGPRTGATFAQLRTVMLLLNVMKIHELHDGVATGVDEQVYYLAKALGIKCHMHPPIKTTYKASIPYQPYDVWYPPKNYGERDRDMVDASQILFSVPKTMDTYPENITGGTGLTTKYAHKLKKPIAIVSPDGMVTYLRGLTYRFSRNNERIWSGE